MSVSDFVDLASGYKTMNAQYALLAHTRHQTALNSVISVWIMPHAQVVPTAEEIRKSAGTLDSICIGSSGVLPARCPRAAV